MKAVKENKVYRIETESEKQRYLKAGYDIYSDDGVLLEHSPLKKIAYSEYANLEKQVADLAKENEALKAELENKKSVIDKSEGEKKSKNSKAGE